MKTEKALGSPAQETFFLRTFPFIRRLAAQKLGRLYLETVEDITQQVMLKLYQWKAKRAEAEFSEEVWLKIANVATQNEIKTFYSKQKSGRKVSLSEAADAGDPAWLIDKTPGFKVEGNTDGELRSLLLHLWREVKSSHTIREKYALLFGKVEIINYLVAYQCCTIEELAAALQLTRAEFIEIYRQLPVGDQEIAGILGRKLDRQITSEHIWKARQRAKAKLAAVSATAGEKGGSGIAGAVKTGSDQYQDESKRRSTHRKGKT